MRPDEIEEGPLTEGAANGEWVDYGLAVSPLKPKTVGRVLSVTAATGVSVSRRVDNRTDMAWDGIMMDNA